MLVSITNGTGTGLKKALLDKDSGVLEYEDGEISHVLFEKQFGRLIRVVKDEEKKETILLEEARKEEAATPSEEQKAKPVKAKKK